ncbi:MAG: sodium-dependent transporter, partial [Actinomycetota bacterium]
GLIEVVLVAWVVRQLRTLQRYINDSSYVRIGSWWIISLTLITPVLLIGITAFNIYTELTTPYEGYPASGLILLGGGVAAAVIVVGFIFQSIRGTERREVA